MFSKSVVVVITQLCECANHHWLLHLACMHAQLLQSCLILCDLTDCNLPGSSVHGIFQARILEWVVFSQFSSVQLLSHVQIFVPHGLHAAGQASLSITNSQSSLKLMSIESVLPSYHFILCCLLLLLPSVFPSIRVFSSELALHIRWPKYWSFSFSISPSSVYSGLISFRMDWLDLLAVQGTLKSLLQHHSSKS